MNKIEANNTVQSTQAADLSKSKKSPALRLDKQVIRTLTGAELQLVSGGRGCTCCTCTCHSSQE